MEIADKCSVHETLTHEVKVRSRLVSERWRARSFAFLVPQFNTAESNVARSSAYARKCPFDWACSAQIPKRSGLHRTHLWHPRCVAIEPGCVKTLRGMTAPGILSPTIMWRAKKRKNLCSARHYDQIRFRFRTAKTHRRHSSGSLIEFSNELRFAPHGVWEARIKLRQSAAKQ
jgi:hypothetical protein